MGINNKKKKSRGNKRGYISIRITLPNKNDTSDTEEGDEDTYLFAKEHQSNNNNSTNDGKKGANKTLFIANVPMIPNVRNDLFLHAIFSQYGEVENVNVIQNPRQQFTTQQGETTQVQEAPPLLTLLHTNSSFSTSHMSGSSSDGKDVGNGTNTLTTVSCQHTNQFGFDTTFNNTHNDLGKFAHVTFTSSKEMKKALKTIMENDESEINVGVDLLQKLIKETREIHATVNNNSDNDSSNEEDEDNESSMTTTNVCQKLFDMRRMKQLKYSSPHILQEQCNTIMERFEQKEEEAYQETLKRKNMPDDDGFITVSYSNSTSKKNFTSLTGGAAANLIGSKKDLDEDLFIDTSGTTSGNDNSTNYNSTSGIVRRRGTRNNANANKKKKKIGATELNDFYSFQTRENKKRNVQELQKQFQEDLQAVKKMKRQKFYKPF